LGLVGLAVFAFLLTSGSTSIASEPGSTPGSEQAGLGSEALVAGWVFVFLALSALYSFERRHRAKPGFAAHQTAGSGHAAADAAARPAAASQRPIELLLRKKPAVTPRAAPRPPADPPPRLKLSEESTLLRRPSSRGAKESGEESFSVADGESLALAGIGSLAAAPATPPGAPSNGTAIRREAGGFSVSPTPDVPREVSARAPAPDAMGQPSYAERCVALRAEGRFEEAARVAREGLAGDDDPGPLLIELSRAELGLGRANAAIDTARDAHFVCRSRESISHLIRLLIETRRFGREDGAMLRRAAARHPEQPLLRHAAGVFESMYGDPGQAQQELREALRLEADRELRAAIERDLARVRAAAVGAGTQPS
jgi:hypothetical protein